MSYRNSRAWRISYLHDVGNARPNECSAFATMTLDNYREDANNRQAIEDARAWDFKRGFLIAGPVGTGKTHLACALGHRWIAEINKHLFWLTTAFVLRRLRTAIQDDALDPAYELGVFADVPLLILDDLGAEARTEWGEEQLFELVNRRTLQDAPTIVTTNYRAEDLAKRIGERIVSRLRGACETVELLGEDRRLSK